MKKKTLSFIAAVALGLTSILGGAATATEAPKVTKYVFSIDEKFYVPYKGNNQKDFPKGLKTGFGSGLTVKGVNKDGSVEFYLITDRGPNADAPNFNDGSTNYSSKFFPAPEFQPQIAIACLKGGKVEITETIGLKDESGKAITGLPIKPGNIGSSNEAALSENLKNLGYDNNGLDTEGIALDSKGNFWVCDEYGPFIAKFDKTGKLLQKYAPGKGLPEVLKYRTPNRGFEGVTVAPNNKVYAAVQSVLDIEGKTAKTAQFTRIVELDPVTGKTKMYAYPVDVEAYKSAKDAKIGDIFAISNTKLLLIEQGKGKDKKMRNLIYLVDLKDATDISNIKVDGKEAEFTADKGKISGIKMASKKLIYDLKANGWDVEKAEGIALLPDKKTIAVVNDNDFGISINVQDNENKDAEVTDYTLYADGNFKYKDKSAKPSLRIVPNSEVERNMYLWLIELPEKLK